MRAEVLDEPMPACQICGRTLEELHALSHDPPGGHRRIEDKDGLLCAQLNLLSGAIYALMCERRAG